MKDFYSLRYHEWWSFIVKHLFDFSLPDDSVILIWASIFRKLILVVCICLFDPSVDCIQGFEALTQVDGRPRILRLKCISMRVFKTRVARQS